jgi:homoserine O-succinyltransferase
MRASVDRGHRAAVVREPRGRPIEIAFVNNMPDSAFSATQAQFARLLRVGAGDIPFRMRCYTLPGVLRSETFGCVLAQSNEDIQALYARGADALIVTGTEPRAGALVDEPYWPHFARLVDWARENTVSALWSCLAAHAATLFLDGVQRLRAKEKVSGVFRFKTVADDWLTFNAPATSLVPHSRHNGISRDDLDRCGYNISRASEETGADVFWRCEPSLFVFLQGHPEYDRETLSKEYRRDVMRFLVGEREIYPSVPESYFSETTVARLERLRSKALSIDPTGCETMLREILSTSEYTSDWAGDAARLYSNWLGLVAVKRADWRHSALRGSGSSSRRVTMTS